MFIWSVSSIFVLTSLFRDRSDLTQKLVVASNAIFEYETRYEGVFEAAYSNNSTENQVGQKAEVQSKGTVDEKNSAQISPAVVKNSEQESKDKASAKVPTKESDVADNNIPVPVTEPSDEIATPANNNQTAEGVVSTDQIVIESPQVEVVSGYVKVHVNVRKDSDVGRAEGHIWTLVKVTKSDGSLLFFGSPSNIGITPNGDVKVPNSGKSFSIRRFKTERFSVPIPGTINGVGDKITEVKVGVIGHDKKVKSVGRNLNMDVQTTKYAIKDAAVQKPSVTSPSSSSIAPTQVSPATQAPTAPLPKNISEPEKKVSEPALQEPQEPQVAPQKPQTPQEGQNVQKAG